LVGKVVKLVKKIGSRGWEIVVTLFGKNRGVENETFWNGF